MSRSKTIKLKKFKPHFFLIKVFNLEHREWCFFAFAQKYWIRTTVGAQRAISVKTVHQLNANDCQKCGLWVN